MGRHKIAIKKIPEMQQRQVCFSKRRKGLFKKAADICAASRACSVAIIIFSAVGNVFTFAHPSVEAISGRFLGGEAPSDQVSNGEPENTHAAIGDDGDSYQEESNDSYDVSDAESDRSDKEEVMITDNNGDETVNQEVGKEKEEKESKEEVMREDNNREETLEQEVGKENEENETRERTQETPEGGQFWWNKPIDDLRLEELLELEKSIMKLRDKVRDRVGFLLVEKPLSLCSWHHK